MRGRLAIFGAASIVLLGLFVFFDGLPGGLCFNGQQYYGHGAGTGAGTLHRDTNPAPSTPGHSPYIQSAAQRLYPPTPKEASNEPLIDRMIVKVALQHEDSSWLDTLFPIWRKNVITLAPVFEKLYPSGSGVVDRGRVASAYLGWIIENWAEMPETVVFLGPGGMEKQERRRKRGVIGQARVWADKQGGERVRALATLDTSRVQILGFTPLRPSTSCIHPLSPSPFTAHIYHTRTAWPHLFPSTPLPPTLSAPHLSPGFAVSRAAVRKRTLDEYMRYWTWLQETDMDDEAAGRAVESVWHVVFGRGVDFCAEV